MGRAATRRCASCCGRSATRPRPSVAANLLGRPGCPPTSSRRIVAAAEGNPLYVEQMLSMLVESKALGCATGAGCAPTTSASIAIPPTIKALLEARLGQLRREERAAIEPASVIGLQFAGAGGRVDGPRASAADASTTSCRRSTRKQLVHAVPMPDDDPIYRFHHHLVRDTIYNGLLKRDAGDAARRLRSLGRQGQRRARPRPRVRGDPRLSPRAGAALSRASSGRSTRRAARSAATRRGVSASAGRRAFARGDMHAAANLLRRAVALLDGDRSAARCRCCPSSARCCSSSASSPKRAALVDEALATADGERDRRVKASAELGADAAASAQRRGGQLGRGRGAADQRDDSALEREGAHGELAKAWRLVALDRSRTAGGSARRRRASPRSSSTRASPATSAWWRAAPSA